MQGSDQIGELFTECSVGRSVVTRQRKEKSKLLLCIYSSTQVQLMTPLTATTKVDQPVAENLDASANLRVRSKGNW